MINISPQRLFLIFSLFFGTIISIITPPFQVPDEINHFYRAYQISEGKFKAVKDDDRVGGYIPESIVLFTSHYSKLTLNTYSRIRFREIKNSAEISLNSSEKVFIDFPNTALYTPISYIPQSISILFLRLMDCKPLYILYIARIITLLFWITLVYISIKIIPFQKWLFVILSILPMSLSVNSSISADIITNALSFLLIAYVLKLAFDNNKFSKKDMLIFSLLVIFLGLAKLIYVSLLFLFLIIPKKKFNSFKHYIFSFIIIFILGFGFAFIGKRSIDRLYTPYHKYNVEYREGSILAYNADMNDQIDFIKNNTGQTVKVFLKSFTAEFNTMIKSYIGRLGWGDTPIPNLIVIISYIIIFLTAISSNYEKFSFNYRQRFIFISVSIIILFSVLLSQYLTWNAVGSDRAYPLQGRYFIPVFPLIFIIFLNHKFSINKILNRYIVLLFTLFIGFFTIFYLYNRFYFNYNLTKQFEIICDAEIVSDDNKFLLIPESDTIKFSNLDFRTNEASYSGDYSIRLNPENQFGFSYKFYDVKKGDKIIVSVRQSGRKGKIVFQEDVKKGLYFKSSKIINKYQNNWYELESEFFSPKDFTDTGLKIYIWYSSDADAYFDDFKITFFKKQSD